MSMVVFLIQRFAQALVTVFVASIIIFTLLRVVPGSPIDFYVSINPFATEEFIDAMEKRMGLDKPLLVQYLIWLRQLTKGDLGTSLSKPGQPVLGLLKSRIVNSLTLSLFSNGVSFLLGVPLGVVVALKRKSRIDTLARLGSLLAYSTPSFYLGLLLIYFFSVHLGILPSSGMRSIVPVQGNFIARALDVIRHMILPAFTLGAIGAAFTTRLTRSSMLEIINEDYIRTARSKGITETKVVWKHMLRNALRPVITVIGLQIGFLFGSAAVTETVFAWPGMGRELVMAAYQRDYPVLIAITIIVSSLFIILNLLVDITYTILDPRVRY